jgi:hypothetical protein
LPTATKEQVVVGSSPYCTKVFLLSSNKYFFGANFAQGSSSETMTMELYGAGDGGIYSIDSNANCDFDASTEQGCEINLDSVLPSDEYYVCISSNNNIDWKIYRNTGGDSCGLFNGNEVTAYSVFVKTPTYAPAGTFRLTEDYPGQFRILANQYLEEHYPSIVSGHVNCSTGCIIPMKISGVDQILNLSNLALRYGTYSGTSEGTFFYEVSFVEDVFDFFGFLDLSFLGFKLDFIGEEVVSVDFGGDSIEEEVEVNDAPVIRGLVPLNVSAGVSSYFAVDYYSSKDVVEVRWDFGDGNTFVGDSEGAMHQYNSFGVKSINVTIIDEDGMSDSEVFHVVVGSPEDFLEDEIDFKLDAVSDAKYYLSTLDAWEENKLLNLLGLDSLESRLNEFSDEYDLCYTDDCFLNLSLELSDVDVPKNLRLVNITQSPLLVYVQDVDVSLLGPNASSYMNEVIAWEMDYLEGSVSEKFLEFSLGDDEKYFGIYDLSVESSFEEPSFFVVGIPVDNINFQGSPTFQTQGGLGVFDIDSEGSLDLQFIVEDYSEDAGFFGYPTLDNLVSSTSIVQCNLNGVCDAGENSDSCREDCPLSSWRYFLWVLIVLLIGLIAYIIGQYYYAKYYVNYVFKSKNDLENVAAFIINARKNKEDNEISNLLLAKKWNEEQIKLGFKKAKGEAVGLPEIIPFSKFERKRLQKVAVQRPMAGAPVSENGVKTEQNVNKGKMPGN